jgi:hypothetical protein
MSITGTLIGLVLFFTGYTMGRWHEYKSARKKTWHHDDVDNFIRRECDM